MSETFARRRYLLNFDSRRLGQVFTDVLVIGGGVGGLRAAIAAGEDCHVLLVTKDSLEESNTAYHQGGIADLELAILDLLEELPARSRERAQLIQVRNLVRTWRRGSGLVFRTKSIIVAEGAADTERRPLATLETAEGEPT